jgi:pyruvate kinase
MRRTKLIATLGPASDGPEQLDALIAAGLNVARLNSSHGDEATLSRQLAAVREAAGRAERYVGVMLDLGGPKLRLGEVAPGTVLAEGQSFELRGEPGDGDQHGAAVSYEGLWADVAPGDRILIDDGKIELEVTGTAPGLVRSIVQTGGPLSSRKGVNIPGVRLGVEGITERDQACLRWGLDAGVDIVAQSFVRSAGDIERLREMMGERRVPIVAKIEKHEAMDALDAIVEAADAVMVARGDLGVELPLEDVPAAQRRIVATCRAAGKPVVVATQMLESMTESWRPTRAEASDVANAIFDHVDAVMLSGETAVGKHPAHTLGVMDRIVRVAERVAVEHSWQPRRGSTTDISAAVSHVACELGESLELACIVTATQTGATARAVAAHRPQVPVLAAAVTSAVARQLTLVWGVRPWVVDAYGTIDEMIDNAAKAAHDAGLAQTGDLVAVTGGIAINVAGSTDFIQVYRV